MQRDNSSGNCHATGILIADAGSTKTDWAFKSGLDDYAIEIQTPGLNPVHLSDKEIVDTIEEARKKLERRKISEIFFYGAGVVSEFQKQRIGKALSLFDSEIQIHVESDMLGASKALFGHTSGIAAILGTGSNSALFIKGRIEDNVPSLGYILGDEGSGAALGKRLLNALFKRQLSYHLQENFYKKFPLSVADAIESIYRNLAPARFLASFVPFLKENIDEPEIRNLVKEEFSLFFQRNIQAYHADPSLPVGFVGSVAYFFSPLLQEVASGLGIDVSRIIKSPVSSLLEFHLLDYGKGLKNQKSKVTCPQ